MTTEVISDSSKSGKGVDKKLIIIGAVIALVVIAFFTNGFGLFGPKSDGTIDTSKLSVDGSPVLGDANAPVTIYIFSDFSCPFCAAAEGDNSQAISALRSNDINWQVPIPAIRTKYVNSGKVKLVFKYYPGHGQGEAAHQVGYCMNQQGLFWRFHDSAFAKQTDTGDMEKMKALAKNLGADMTELQSCLDSADPVKQLSKEIALAQSMGIQGTPTFFVGNQEISGAQSFQVFDKVIQAQLN